MKKQEVGEASPPEIPLGLGAGEKLCGTQTLLHSGALWSWRALQEVVVSGIWGRQDPSTGFPTSANTPSVGPQRNRDVLPWKQSLTDISLSYLGVQTTNDWRVPILSDALETVYLDRAQGGHETPRTSVLTFLINQV